MKNTYFQANLTSPNKITVMLFTAVTLSNFPSFFLVKDEEEKIKLKTIRHMSNNNVSLYELELPTAFEYGHRYVLLLEGFPRINIDVSNATTFPDFDEKFYYDGDDLGAIYTKEETKFNLWAPLASDVSLRVEDGDDFKTYTMVRGDKGVFRYAIKGDLLNKKYYYIVNNSGVLTDSIDPWGKGVSFNSKYSAVVDVEAIKKMKKIAPKNIINEPADAIIYETSIRDFSEDKHSDIVNRGKYLGMVEEKRHTKGNNPAGLDYLKMLGITHLQILPVIDFLGADDANPNIAYNWGYNPISFFAIEGSYANDPYLPMARLYEFREMVDKLHANNIRVVMDVVYNHLYEFMYTAFEKVVPNYFYRKRSSGLPACASGCGDDFASERKMASKAIYESLTYFTDVFDIDGFRFDLMGLIDIDTINRSYEACKKMKKDTIFYGEGWNMGIELPFEKKACSENASKMPNIGFFNDLYRDVLRGGNFKDNITQKGFVGGNADNKDLFIYVMLGSMLDKPYKKRYLSANQSLNYIECHDNNTLYDKLSFSNPEDDQQTLLKRVWFANTLNVLSFGMTFIHMGQEIGLSKNGLDNTYNVLKVNNMDWALVDERFEMVRFISQLIYFKKNLLSLLNIKNVDEGIKAFTTIDYWGNGIIALSNEKAGEFSEYKKFAVLINPSNENKTYELDDYYYLLTDLINKGDKIHVKNGILPPLSVQILYLK